MKNVLTKIKNFLIAVGIAIGAIVLFLLGRNGINSKKRTDRINDGIRECRETAREIGKQSKELSDRIEGDKGKVSKRYEDLSNTIERDNKEISGKCEDLSKRIEEDAKSTSERIDKLSERIERDNKEISEARKRVRKTRKKLEQRINQDQG